MNTQLFQEARAQYAQKDYQGALQLFTNCLNDPDFSLAPGEVGRIQHQIGNCLIKLKDPKGAIAAYNAAADDTAYGACGTVNYNLGMAYVALRDFETAVQHFEIAVSDASYDSKYKAYSNMGSALLRLGRNAEAGVAFREAALDDANPDPTKALLNLGVCFMALERPADAIASYESALQFNMQPDTRNKMYANLGQAYTATGQMKKAVQAFERALADKTYFLSDSAAVDFSRAVSAVSQGTNQFTPVKVDLAAQAEGRADMSGLDTLAEEGTAMLDPVVYDQAAEGDYMQPYAGDYAPMAPQQPANDAFFEQGNQTVDWSQDFQKTKKKRGSAGMKVFIFLLIVIIAAFGAGAYAYTQGYGFPTQDSVVTQLFSDPEGNADAVFAKDLTDDKVKTLASSIVKSDNVTIDGVNRSMNESTVFATVGLEEGGSVQYQVTMVRDMIGWKVANVELYHASQQE